MNKSIRWLLVGAGDIARKRVGPAIKKGEGGELAAVCDIDISLAENLAAELNVIKVFDSFEHAIREKKIDAVYIATPIFLHKKMAIDALKAGKHVLVEKPMAMNSRDAKEMNLAAEESGRKLGVSYFRRYFSKYDYVKNMLNNSEFGDIVLVRLAYFSWYNPAPNDPKYWRVIKEKSGGGVISDMGTHMFDLLIGLFGLPVSICAKIETNIHSYSVEDSASILMKLKCGAQVVSTFHWCSKTWTHEFEIIGTEAKIKWHPFDAPSFTKTVGRESEEIIMPPEKNVHLPLIEDFNNAILDNISFLSPGNEAIKTNVLVDKIYQSSTERKEILL